MKILPFMVRQGEQKHITENYVSIPPALVITDEAGNVWTFGFNMGPINGGEYTFNVLCNGTDTGKFANRIERRNGRIKILTTTGWETMQVTAVPHTKVFAIGVKVPILIESIDLVQIRVYFEPRPDFPVASFSFNPMRGSIVDLRTTPIICDPGIWLYATVEPKIDVVVAGYLGDTSIRDIPVREGEKV